MSNASNSISRSWVAKVGAWKIEQLLDWIRERNEEVSVSIVKAKLGDNKFWYYDNAKGCICNRNDSFFKIYGLEWETNDGKLQGQPIIIQDEIGYLGILSCEIEGVMHFLMQAKIEPGNVNHVQISPTIQATKSNFSQMHGGAKPAYLDYFLNAKPHEIVIDQIQSEQSSRFLGKRNRNIIIHTEESVEVLPSHRWMTLGQIKALMHYNNLVNMDTRTVLSCIPFYKFAAGLHSLNSVNNPALIRSIIEGEQADILPKVYHYINNYKMFHEGKSELVPLYSLKNWETKMIDGIEEFVCKLNYPFKVVFCDISIGGREVHHWEQPLFEAQGMAVFGLLTRINADGGCEFLVHAKPEVGCFDRIELGPTVQLEASELPTSDIDKLFFNRYKEKQGIKYDVVLSEEGGRFYHEQNKNIIIEFDLIDVPPGYWWLTYRTLNQLTQINNILNIQLRNLLSLLEV